MRLVLDTNVVLSALLWHGTPHELVAAGRKQDIVFFSSRELIHELAGVLKRRKFAEVLKAGNLTAEEVLRLYTGFARIVDAKPLTDRVSSDPYDDMVLACALSVGADLIVSGDSDLLELKQYKSIPIVTAADALTHIFDREL